MTHLSAKGVLYELEQLLACIVASAAGVIVCSP